MGGGEFCSDLLHIHHGMLLQWTSLDVGLKEGLLAQNNLCLSVSLVDPWPCAMALTGYLGICLGRRGLSTSVHGISLLLSWHALQWMSLDIGLKEGLLAQINFCLCRFHSWYKPRWFGSMVNGPNCGMRDVVRRLVPWHIWWIDGLWLEFCSVTWEYALDVEVS